MKDFRMFTRRGFARTLSAPLALAMAGCAFLKPSPNTPPGPTTPIESLIQNIITGAETALATVGSYTNIAPALLQTISSYLGAIGMTATGVIKALQGGSVLTKADSLVQALASLAKAPVLSGVIPVPVAIIIAGVAAAVDAFVNFLPTAPSTAPAARRNAVSKASQRMLGDLEARAVMVTVNAKALPR